MRCLVVRFVRWFVFRVVGVDLFVGSDSYLTYRAVLSRFTVFLEGLCFNDGLGRVSFFDDDY